MGVPEQKPCNCLGIVSTSSSRGKMFFFSCPRTRLRNWSRETGSAVPSRVSPLVLQNQAESGAVLTRFLSLSATASIFYTTIGLVLRSLTRGHRHRTSSPQGSSSNGCCIFRYHHGPINVRFSFPTPTISVLAEDIDGRRRGTREEPRK